MSDAEPQGCRSDTCQRDGINKAEQIGGGADRAALGIKEKAFGLGNRRVDCDGVPGITGLTDVLD